MNSTLTTGNQCDDGAVMSISERAREQVVALLEKREGVKRPLGGFSGSEGASRWELLKELEGAYGLVADLAERVERLERRIETDQ